ncbi:unnamed protein product [Caenorhabditis angaria]|uniref:DNA2/NAM7 helicase-like C-terminal domain-containing protein n=1 Tax=Caenorhabditis angaria TaxID=860376 RepID=A0A9P1IUR1_9PELO|nr:unnamed protein product [Caenorhabditis angaria]
MILDKHSICFFEIDEGHFELQLKQLYDGKMEEVKEEIESARIRDNSVHPWQQYYELVISKRGNVIILTPLFNEVVANDRLDLRLVHLNKHAIDLLNPGRIKIEDYYIGDILCVFKLQQKQMRRGSTIFKFTEKNNIAKLFVISAWLRSLSPYRTSKGNFLCVSSSFSTVIEMNKDILPGAYINQLLSAEVVSPILTPGQFLLNFNKDNRITVAKMSPRLITTNTYAPFVISAKEACSEVKEIFENYQNAFAKYNREKAYGILEVTIGFGSNGLLAIKNQNIDSHRYKTKLQEYTAEIPYAYFSFTIYDLNDPPTAKKWNRAVMVKISTETDFFYADVLSAQKNRENLLVQARCALESFDWDMFKRLENRTVEVKQCKEYKSCPINYEIDENSNADKLIQALYGGNPIPFIDFAIESNISIGTFKLLETQTKYAKMVADEKLSALIGSSSFGCGKTAAIASAAIHSLHVNPKSLQMVTAVTNSAVVALIEKIIQLKPNIKIVRIISTHNTTVLPSTQLTDFDYPTVLAELLKECVMNPRCDIAENLLNQMLAYLKKHNILYTNSFRTVRMRNMFQNANGYNDEDILNFFMDHEKPTIIVGTVASILYFFSKSWKSWVNRVNTIQIDEASGLPRETLLKITTLFPNSKYSLVRDYRPPHIYYESDASKLIIDTAIGETLRDCLSKNRFPSVHFNEVFRRRRKIVQKLGKIFYDSTLESFHIRDGTETELQNSPSPNLQTSNKSPIIFISTDRSKHSKRGTLLTNTGETKTAVRLAKHLLKYIDKEDIAILCFHRAQINELRCAKSGVYVGSVDSVQGREWPVCIICTTRTLNYDTSSFMVDARRINFVLSRSKILTFILGHSKTKSGAHFWKDIITTSLENKTLVESDDFENILDPENSSTDSDDEYQFMN